MDYTPDGPEIPVPEAACLFDVGSLYHVFEGLTDGRKDRGKRYGLAFVLAIIVMAKLSGEDKPLGIAEWAKGRQRALVKAFGIGRETVPSHNTYRRILRDAVSVTELESMIYQVLSGRQEQPDSEIIIAIDGKTLRGTLKGPEPVHLLAAYLPDAGIVLMQVAVDRKENEIVAAPRLLSCLDLRQAIVIGDAMHTQRSLAVQIVEAGGDYVSIVKDNQPALRQDIETLFEPELCTAGFSAPATDFQTATTTNYDHGRYERRTLTTSCLLRDYLDWPYLAQVFQLQRTVTDAKTGEHHQQTVYGITSLPPHRAPPERLLTIVRSYWGIENGLFYRRDATLNEDSTRMTRSSMARNMASINNLLIGLLRQAGHRYLPSARRFYSAHFSEAAKLILRCPS